VEKGGVIVVDMVKFRGLDRPTNRPTHHINDIVSNRLLNCEKIFATLVIVHLFIQIKVTHNKQFCAVYHTDLLKLVLEFFKWADWAKGVEDRIQVYQMVCFYHNNIN
jgi:hypothetical protein